MRRWAYLVLLAWVGFPTLVAAKMPSMDDFAYGLRIDVPAGVAVAAVNLPETVYKSVHRMDLGDMRVFNGHGEPVPHLLRFARSQTAEAPWRPLPFFLIPDSPGTEKNDYRVVVRTGPDGAVVRIDPQGQPAAKTTGRTVLIDSSHLALDLSQLRLHWPPGSMNRMVFFSVDASNDLVHWQRLRAKAVISDIRYGGHRLATHIIELSTNHQRYIRLIQLDNGPAVPLTAINGRARPEGGQSVRSFLVIDGQRIADAPGRYVYDTGGAFPVDRINLLFDQPNSMADAQLASRSTRQSQWRNRGKGLFYRIDIQGTALTSSSQPVAVSMDRHWRLAVEASDSTIGRSVPRLRTGYRPHDLFFIARGGGPFTLAFGSTRIEPLKTNLAALVDSINQSRKGGIEHWIFPQAAPFELGGAQRLTPPPKPLPTRRVILWSVLLAGVFIVAALAWRLAHRLKP